MDSYTIALDQLGMRDVARVGGKNASLGEMIRALTSAGVRVPEGFATTADAFREFLARDGLAERIHRLLDSLDVDDLEALAGTGGQVRGWIANTPFPERLERAIEEAYQAMACGYGGDLSVAVRSSATAEDLPDASFAGQQETYLNVGGLDSVKRAIKDVFASLYNDRAIAYRAHHGFMHRDVALSAGVQRMIRSDLAASGVMFTLDTESGFRGVVFITAGYGLGETVVQGAVNPDEFYVYKPALAAGHHAILRRNLGAKAIRMVCADATTTGTGVQTQAVPLIEQQRFCIDDGDVLALARLAVAVENHYQRPMDIEWAKDGVDGELYLVQARPETVQTRSGSTLQRYQLTQKGEVIVSGRSIGSRIGAGTARIVRDAADMGRVQPGDVLVTDMTDPDWEPIMKRTAAIVTNRGGRTCHAAIIARELGVPAVVGCGDATTRVGDGEEVTISCAEGDTGYVYRGRLSFDVRQVDLEGMPELPVKIMMNVGNPERAFQFAALPNAGVGLARLEFIINNMIGVHPQALLDYGRLPAELQAEIGKRMAGYADPLNFYVEKLTEGIACIAAAFAPQPAIVRLSDFKSNEYATLLGGDRYEPREENPMLGFRGAARYLAASFRPCFDLECRALRRAREDLGLTNIWVMVPMVRTLTQAKEVVDLLAENGLRRDDNGLKLIMMCELPANAILAESFLEYFDGFSIGSNDLTQLTLGLDRDSSLVAGSFDERDPAVLALIARVIKVCRQAGKYIGICGQGPSDHPDMARWLLDQGIASLSLNPDAVISTWLDLAAHVAKRSADREEGAKGC
ncbi:MAG: phosphoenolpyruvate synthase [Chromatiales bacterium]